MNNLTIKKNRDTWQKLLKSLDCNSLRELSLKINVSELQLLRIIHGLLAKMPLETALKVAQGLNISLNELISLFYFYPDSLKNVTNDQSLAEEYKNLQNKYEQQQQQLNQQFQLSTLEKLESLLLQLPTAIVAVRKNPQLPASRLLPLLKPLEQLLQSWGLKTIASVGDKIPYNPTEHELMEGVAQPGDLVEVRYLGYRQGDNLLYRAKVSPTV